MLGLTLTLLTLAAGWQFAHTTAHFYVLGFFLGIAGASFAVALPLASRWYPPEYQGLAMGIAGAGNSGTLLATLFAPRLAERFGWAATFGIAMVPVAAVFVLFALIARDSPTRWRRRRCADYGALLREPDTLSLSFLYSLTFGGFVGFASFLTTFFHEQYHVSRVVAGDFTTIVVVAGSLLRPVGGWLADRFGGYRLLVVLLAGFCRLRRRSSARLPPVRRGRGAAVRRRWGCSAWATARSSSSCRSAFPIASASSPASSARPAGSAASSCRRCSARAGRDRLVRAGPVRLRGGVPRAARSCCSSSALAGRSAGSRRRRGRRACTRIGRRCAARRREAA